MTGIGMVASFWDVASSAAAEIALIDGRAPVFDLTPYFEKSDPTGVNDGQSPPASASNDGGQPEDGDAPVDEDIFWRAVTLENVSDAPLNIALAIHASSFRGSRWGLTTSEPLEALQAFAIDGEFRRPLNTLTGAAGEKVFQVYLPQVGRTIIAVQFSGDPQNFAVYGWQLESYEGYRAALTLSHGALLGVLLIMAALLVALWVFAETTFCLAAGIFSFAILAFLTVDFGYIDPIASFFGWFNIGLRDGAFTLVVASGLTLVITMLTFDPADLPLKRQLEYLLYGNGFVFLTVFFSIPYSLYLMRIVTVLTIAAAAYAIWKQVSKGMPATRVSIPGWLIIALSYGAAFLLNYLPGSTRNLVIEPLVSFLLVFGTLLVSFAIATQANARPFHTVALRSLRRPDGLSDDGAVQTKAEPPLQSQKATRVPQESDENRLVDALGAAKEAVWEWTVKGDQLYLSPYMAELLGSDSLPKTEQEWFERVHPDEQISYRESLASYLALGSITFTMSFRVERDDGVFRLLELRGRCVADERGQPQRCVGLVCDITDRKIEEVVEQAAAIPAPVPASVPAPVTEDPLTQLPNRSAFIEGAQTGLLAAISNQYDHDQVVPPAILLLDIDRFTSFNEGLGQNDTDGLLVDIARRLGSVIDPDDIIGRVGGDEFAIFTPGGPQAPGAGELAGLLQDFLGQPIEVGGTEVCPTASIGIAVCDDSEMSAEALLENAEKALYEAKKSGGGRVEIYSAGMGEERGQDVAIESDLRRALDSYEMEVYYQPIMDLADGRIAGFESLIRWNHPERGLIGPDKFVSHAERLGLITRLDRFSLSMTSIQLSQWQQFFALEKPLFSSINLSAKQLTNGALISDIREIMKNVDLAPGSLKLEITETSIIEDEEEALRILQELRDLGVGIVLDDFGTGHSSLERLKKFPFDTIKIDQSFIVSLDKDEEAKIMVRSAIELAHELNIEVVAEGVETEQVGRELFQMGCNFAQGFVFGAPMSAMEAQAFIANYWTD